MTAGRDRALRSKAAAPAPDDRSYAERMRSIEAQFEASLTHTDAGAIAIAARAAAVDDLVQTLWSRCTADAAATGVALLAVGGYGRGELFPFSDVDLLFLHDGKSPPKAARDAVRQMNQALWDAGLRVSPMTRSVAECERFDPENVEFTLSLLDARPLTGDVGLSQRLCSDGVPKLLARERKKIVTRLLEVTRVRHRKYGDTLFHLEPNIKDCPGGLRDSNVCAWLARLKDEHDLPAPEYASAHEFLKLARTFLHLRHRRDDNTLDWRSQDDAAQAGLGIPSPTRSSVEPGYWMRVYFRQARAIERRTAQELEEAGVPVPGARTLPSVRRRREVETDGKFTVRQSRIALAPANPGSDPAHDPDVVLAIFTTAARTGARLTRDTEQRLEQALPRLSSHLEDGPALWRQLAEVLTGPYAGAALRSIHALGVLELVLPEFHGIDALVVRDAYHRYTVDEHTFVLIDVLHRLDSETTQRDANGLDAWHARYRGLLRDLPHPALLYMAALMHDTGKARAGVAHAAESVRLAAGVLDRLEVDPYERALVLDLIRSHLEMSAAMRRDVFDRETISTLTAQVRSPEALKMLTLFTYADICAVHPDAMTPWKAENLWHLYLATASFLDRNVDDERVAGDLASASSEALHRVHALLPGEALALHRFLQGFPKRYLATRSPEVIAAHFSLARKLNDANDVELDLIQTAEVSTLTMVTRDRPRLFASVAGALAGWGMNITGADAFSNGQGVVVDTFRFTDTFRTLELNQDERIRFLESMRGMVAGTEKVEKLLSSRQRRRRPLPKVHVETRLSFDASASAHSTLLEVVTEDTPGLLYALALTFADHRCNIEVALVDTEGETAIDVFYLTRDGDKLQREEEQALREALLQAIDAPATGEDRKARA